VAERSARTTLLWVKTRMRRERRGALLAVEEVLFEFVRKEGSSSSSRYFSVIFSRTTRLWSMILFPLKSIDARQHHNAT